MDAAMTRDRLLDRFAPAQTVALMQLGWNVTAAADRVRRAELSEFGTLCDLVGVEGMRASMLGL